MSRWCTVMLSQNNGNKCVEIALELEENVATAVLSGVLRQ